MEYDAERVIKALARFEALGKETDRAAFRDDLADLLEHYYGRSLKDVKIGPAVAAMMEVAHRHRLKFPPDLLLLGRAFLTMEGVGNRLNPGFSVIEVAEPFAKDWLVQHKARPARAQGGRLRDVRLFRDAHPDPDRSRPGPGSAQPGRNRRSPFTTGGSTA